MPTRDPTMSDMPVLPPLLSGERVGGDVFGLAVARAHTGARPGSLVYRIRPDLLSLAIVLTPEMPLADAMGVVMALQLGASDSLGSLGPPETAIHLAWPDTMRINGAAGPVWRAASSHADPDAEPDWLVAAVDIPLRTGTDRPGDTPDRTVLAEEGFEPIEPARLIESLARHMLVWIHRFVEEGFAPVGAAWIAACPDIGCDITAPVAGRMMGIDERGGLILARDGRTTSFPLTAMLTTP